MQLSTRVFDQQKTSILKSLFNVFDSTNPLSPLAEKEIKDLVLAGANPNVVADCGFCNGYTWLGILSDHLEGPSCTNLIAFLLANGANPNCNERNMSPLMAVCSRGYYPNVLLLLNGKTNVNARNFKGNSALTFAIGDLNKVNSNRYPIVELLLQKGASFDLPDANGETPLSLARKHGLHEIVKLFQLYRK